MRRSTACVAALVAALTGCGGPSADTLHDAHRGQTTAQIRAALGDPANSENLPVAEGSPARERWVYPKSKALGVADDGHWIAIEFSGGKEDRTYELDQAQYQQAFGDANPDEAVKQLQDRTKR